MGGNIYGTVEEDVIGGDEDEADTELWDDAFIAASNPASKPWVWDNNPASRVASADNDARWA